ncbi:MAG: GNAT family N-acetyltransferase [Chloroflexota bacterium]|nr:GNAT family N-acetyltransferase [Chloroflexota bacterium]
MTNNEVISRSDANYFHAWRSIVAAKEGGEVVEGDGVLIANSGMPVAWFNIGFITRRLAEPEGAIRRIAAYFDERHMPFIIRLREGLDPDAERAAEGQGIAYADTVPGMVLDAMPPAADATRELEIRTVDDTGAMQHHVDVIAQSFEMPLDFARQFVSEDLIRIPDVELYVGYVGGQPVASSALVASHRTAGVYNVGCLDSHRRRGFGAAMTWHAVRRGADIGCSIASLQASEMGRPVYERMGFRLVAPYRTFMRPEHHD